MLAQHLQPLTFWWNVECEIGRALWATLFIKLKSGIKGPTWAASDDSEEMCLHSTHCWQDHPRRLHYSKSLSCSQAGVCWLSSPGVLSWITLERLRACMSLLPCFVILVMVPLPFRDWSRPWAMGRFLVLFYLWWMCIWAAVTPFTTLKNTYVEFFLLIIIYWQFHTYIIHSIYTHPSASLTLLPSLQNALLPTAQFLPHFLVFLSCFWLCSVTHWV